MTRKLLEGGDKVKLTVLFRGREITHPDIGWKLLQRMAESLGEQAAVDGQPLMQGKRMSVTFSPVAKQGAKVKQEAGKS